MATNKFHINGRGDPGVCKAKNGTCPFGTIEDHFKSEAEARSAYEESMGNGFKSEIIPSESSFYKAVKIARESSDPNKLMAVARGTNKRAIRELAANPTADADVLAEASTKIDENSNDRKALEAHANFPIHALSRKAIEERMNSNSYEFISQIDPSKATDNLLLAVAKEDKYGGSYAGLKVVAMLSDPDNAITDKAREEVARYSEIYAPAAAASGRFPNDEFLTKASSLDSTSAIIYGIKGVQSPERLEKIWEHMSKTDWGTWSAQELIRNPNTPRALHKELGSRASQPTGPRGYRESYSSPSSSSYSSSSSESILSPTNPASPSWPGNF